jgi:hypothetical protein
LEEVEGEVKFPCDFGDDEERRNFEKRERELVPSFFCFGMGLGTAPPKP